MRAIVDPRVAKFVDGLVARHVVSADPHVVERLKVEVEAFVNSFTTAEEEGQPSAADLDAVADEQKAAAETTAAAVTLGEPKGDGSESN